ncbi:hypothetical protein E4V51_03170 [Paenibacillus sp. 28ISP30-2]|nr:hypothetical protein [Paenibacillus sp. 28ISP30-2]
MSKFDFVNDAGHLDNEPFSLMENREEQRRAEKLFLNKLAMLLDDFSKKNRDPTRPTAELSSDDDT